MLYTINPSTFPVAIVVLNHDYVGQWNEKDNSRTQSSNTEENLKQVVLNDMLREGRERGLMPYEQVKTIEFIKEPFTIENGLVTPTFKVRRFAIEKLYKDTFIALYKTIES